MKKLTLIITAFAILALTSCKKEQLKITNSQFDNYLIINGLKFNITNSWSNKNNEVGADSKFNPSVLLKIVNKDSISAQIMFDTLLYYNLNVANNLKIQHNKDTLTVKGEVTLYNFPNNATQITSTLNFKTIKQK